MTKACVRCPWASHCNKSARNEIYMLRTFPDVMRPGIHPRRNLDATKTFVNTFSARPLDLRTVFVFSQSSWSHLSTRGAVYNSGMDLTYIYTSNALLLPTCPFSSFSFKSPSFQKMELERFPHTFTRETSEAICKRQRTRSRAM